MSAHGRKAAWFTPRIATALFTAVSQRGCIGGEGTCIVVLLCIATKKIGCFSRGRIG
jgi:hypothetical protein